MLHIPKIGGYLKILIDDMVKDFTVINFGEYFKFTGEKLYAKQVRNKILEKLLNPFMYF